MTVARPLVSIVFTTYNAARFIKTSLAAALAQDYPNFEVIVADDGSTDETERICRAIDNPRLKFIPLGRVGRCRALNRAVAAARGKYIANNDADDISLPHRLAYVMDFLEAHPDVAYVGTDVRRVETFSAAVPPERIRSTLQASSYDAKWPSRDELYRRNLFNHSTLVYPKSTWQAIGGYDEALGLNEDYDFYLRALQHGRAALLPAKTIVWCFNSNGYFRQKGVVEYLKVMSTIKMRARRLLGLPSWLLLYHYFWTAYYCINRFRGALLAEKQMRRNHSSSIKSSRSR